jgi:hypothetical protein
MADKDFKVKSGLDLGTPLPLTEGGTGQTSASNALNALLPLQTSNSNKFLQTDGTSTSWVSAAVVNNATFTGSSLVIPSGTNAERPASPVVGAIRLNTDQGTLEFWTGSAWGAIATFPQPPRNLVATDVGTSRAFNNASASIAFDLPTGNGGSTITSYKITSNPGGYFATGSSSPIVLTGLESNVSYTFTGTATNSIGEGASSLASSSVLATTIPQPVTIGTATVLSSTSVSVPFTPGGTGGKNVTYTVNSNVGSFTATGSSSPITVTGAFANGTSYTFTVTASNANGSAAASAASNSVTPVPAYELSSTFNTSGTYTVPSGKSQMAVFVMGGGSSGGGASAYEHGRGGRSAALVGFRDYSVTPGQNFSVAVASANGTSSFGNLVDVSTNADKYPVGSTFAAGVNGGVNGGASGQGGPSINLSESNLPTYNSGGSGGAGAIGARAFQNSYGGNISFFNPGSAGSGSSGGGNGGAGGNFTSNAGFGDSNTGGSGGSANQRGAGGGGGGQGGYGLAMDFDGSMYQIWARGGGGGGSGGSGQVVVYIR